MTELLDTVARIAIERIQHLTDVYEDQPEVSLHQHVRATHDAPKGCVQPLGVSSI